MFTYNTVNHHKRRTLSFLIKIVKNDGLSFLFYMDSE